MLKKSHAHLPNQSASHSNGQLHNHNNSLAHSHDGSHHNESFAHPHSGEHHHHVHIDANTSVKVLVICLVVNLVFVAVEAIIGWRSNSTGLLSDAGHNLSDALGLLLALVAVFLQKRANKSGLKLSKYLTLINGLLLLLAVGLILIESIGKIIKPMDVNGTAVIYTSGLAIIVNGLTALMLMKGQGANLNIKAAYLHAATDMLVSVAVVVSGVLISLTGLNIIDPILSLCVSILIAIPALKLTLKALCQLRN